MCTCREYRETPKAASTAGALKRLSLLAAPTWSAKATQPPRPFIQDKKSRNTSLAPRRPTG